jgi:hypothetical protein
VEFDIVFDGQVADEELWDHSIDQPGGTCTIYRAWEVGQGGHEDKNIDGELAEH